MTLVVGQVSGRLWQGLAADKAALIVDARLAINDVFFETDTFKYYLWDGTKLNPTTSAGGTGGTPPMR